MQKKSLLHTSKAMRAAAAAPNARKLPDKPEDRQLAPARRDGAVAQRAFSTRPAPRVTCVSVPVIE